MRVLSADRDTYTRRTQGEMQEWQQKLHAFGEKAKAKGRQGQDSTRG